ncbi:unnamed protein product [Vitrella brassicaformis CCMP3155]|uniref:TLDc domain-containing protein n=1 Tax=Vitrella brassicaformis (strain CCMP3155) TaxID=1169540 RepID=A0A0G4H1L2_VITBC|nr:unnamed protein product [Vitrella brassicaformis CCMP3155]|eukprot:CEM37388.1 unnamed protein product [Vitrella brassicaformis CCMP3155]
MGGTGDLTEPSAECMREVLEFSLSGEYFRARRSTLCGVKGSVIALLFCGAFDQAFIRDQNNRILLQVFPRAFKWLVGKLDMYVAEQTDSIVIPPSRQNDTPFKYWVELLMSDPGYPTKRRANRVQIPPLTQGHQQQQQQQGDGGQQQPQADAEALSVELVSMIRRAKDARDAQLERLEAIRPLLKTGNTDEDSLVSIDVSGATVTVTKGVATSLGDDSTFANIFLKHDGRAAGFDVEHVHRIVDIVARAHMKGTAISAQDVHEAKGGEIDETDYRSVLDMYGLDSDRYLGPIDGLLTTDHLHKMRQWCEGDEDAPPIPPCVGEPVHRIYKATVDGWRWLDFFDAVRGHSPLVLISKVADSNELFAMIIEGPIEVTGAAISDTGTETHAFKLRGTDSHPHVGFIGCSDQMTIAGTQERVTELMDYSLPDSELTALLWVASFSFGVRPTAQQIGAPAEASDESMKRCQGHMLEENQPDEWRQWQRPSVRPSDHDWDEDVVFLPVSVKGWHFEMDELEGYVLA